jgi:hypothetical protein
MNSNTKEEVMKKGKGRSTAIMSNGHIISRDFRKNKNSQWAQGDALSNKITNTNTKRGVMELNTTW